MSSDKSVKENMLIMLISFISSLCILRALYETIPVIPKKIPKFNYGMPI